MRAWTLGSGSRGNAILLESGETRILIDAGYSARTLGRRLAVTGVAPESIHAVIVTHEHIDHIRGLGVAVPKWRWPVYGSAETLAGIGDLEAGQSTAIGPGAARVIGDIEITLVPVPHDAAGPTAVIATDTRTGFRACVAHDLGCMPPDLAAKLGELDLVMLESNHDEEMLRTGPYPLHLQRRVASDRGHLSNRQSADALADAACARWRDVVLLHLSETNNTPLHATSTVERMLRRARCGVRVTAAPQDVPAGPFGDPSAGARQFELLI